MEKKIAFVIVSIWAIIIGIGTVWITDYSTRPGEKANSPADLPAGVYSENPAKLPKLFVFLHPHCPCSRATVTELSRLVSANKDSMEVRILFYQPDDQPREWVETDLWQQASNIPNAELFPSGEEEIKKYGAITSGQVLLYATDGKLVFSGGITKMRGHEGDNLGSDLIGEYLRGERTSYAETPVFGCILTTLD